jgi:deoxyribonucleoside regulator
VSDDLLLLRAAHLYYRAGLTQAEVAERLGAGRVKVSRLLAEALDRGIVRIEIQHPLARLAELEYEVKERFGLEDVVVAASTGEPGSGGEELALASVASAAAAYLRDLRPSPETLGVSWGRTMYALASRIPEGWAEGTDVVQLNGALSRTPTPTHADFVAGRLAETAGGVAHLLAAPAIVERADIRAALESDRGIAQALDLARRADVAIFSLGALSEDSVLVASGYLDGADIRRLRAEGCVGDVLSRFITADGAIADPDLDARTVGLALSDLASKRWSIGVAAGAAKTDVARAVIAGGYVNALVVDEEIATGLLE